MKRKILSLILVFAMTVSLFTVGTGAVEPTYGDTAGHWAESSIERWSAYGIIQGSNGQFDPNGQLTCAQLATILAKLLKLPAAKDAGFTDNTADAWYYDAINRCAAAGILNGNGDGTVTPEAPITRERAMVMLARALGIEPLRKPDLAKYTDAAQVSAYAQGYVAALIEAGIVGGVTADELAPQANINRASTVTILDRAISTYADQAGATVKADGKGIVLVVADDVTVTGEVNKLLVPANDIEVTVKGSKNIDDITVTGDNSKVILDNASADNVTLDGEKSAVETKNGAKIDNVIMSENASGATVDVGSGTTIGNVENHAEDATVTGSGTVKKVESDKDITVKTKDTDVKNIGDEKITVTDKSGKDTTIGTTGSGSSTTVNKGTTSSSGGGYSHSHSYDTSKWVFDDTTHWHASTCGHNLKIDEAAHKYNENNVCTVCGQVNPTVTVAKIGDKNYATLADAMTYAVNNDTIVLVKPETITSAVFTENKSVTLDLNGQTLTANVESNKAAIQVDGSNAALTIKDSSGSGKISSTGYGVYALNGASVTVESGSIESYVSPLSGNNTTGNMNFTVKGGTLTAQKGPAIYMPGQVNLVITGGTLNGGISLRMGQVNISGGTINAVTSDIDAPSSFYNYSGNAWLPDALYVFGGTYTSDDATYGNSLNLNITGGAFNCTNGQGSAVAIYDLGKVAQTMNVNISGNAVLTTTATSREAYQVLSLSDIGVASPAEGYGNAEHTGKVSSSITGGTFSSDPTAYVAEGYIARENNGKYVVSMVGTAENPYTLTEFNALTKLPAGRDKLYVDIGDVSLADGDVTIGNKDICDMWTWDRNIDHKVGDILEDGRKVYMVRENDTIYSSNKTGITLYISGSVNENPEGGLNQSNSHAITLSIPDASDVVFTKDFTVNGYLRMFTGWSDGRNLGGAFYNRTVKTVLFDHSTFNGIWIQNGGFFADSLTLDGCTFNAYENKVSANDSNPLWFCNIRTCDVTVKNCTFKASRPIKVVEQGVFGANVTITGNKFDMSMANSADDASKPKNDAIMFSTLIGETQWNPAGTLGNVVVSGNEVTGANALLTFFNPSQITMANGATFTVSGNTLNNAALSVVWKSTDSFVPSFITGSDVTQ